MRISDWSSDVCSSDLAPRSGQFARRVVERFVGHVETPPVHPQRPARTDVAVDLQRLGGLDVLCPHEPARRVDADGQGSEEIGRASCRGRGCKYGEYSVVSVSIKKKKKRTKTQA